MTTTQDINALLVMEQCNPTWPSVPLVAYNFYDQISRRCRTTLVTHERNRDGLEPVRAGREILYIPESGLVKRYYSLVVRVTQGGGVNWPLQHALSYPVYAAFNNAVYRRFSGPVREGIYDLVHALTPMLPRYPVRIVRACGESRGAFRCLVRSTADFLFRLVFQTLPEKSTPTSTCCGFFPESFPAMRVPTVRRTWCWRAPATLPACSRVRCR